MVNQAGRYGLRWLLASALSLPVTLPALAQVAEKMPATVDAYAAGYRAAFTCSAVFNAGKSLEAIERDELTGIYPALSERVKQFDAQVDHQHKRVTVTYSEQMPPRIALWRPQLGCVQLPVGASLSKAHFLPQIAADEQPATDTGEPWQQRAEVNGSSGNQALDKVIDKAFSKAYGAGARTSAVLIATPDAIIAERYQPGFTPETSQRTWSVAKSIAVSVVGAAVQQALIDVKAPTAIQRWSHALDPRGAISVEHLLHMSSGLDSNIAGNRTDRLYVGGGALVDTALARSLEAAPGTRWKYANNDTLLAMRSLRERFDNVEAYLAFPHNALLNKIGMQHTHLESDWQGDYVMSSQVWTTSRDLARLGLLYLQRGQWQGEQILPKDWLAYVSAAAPAQPPEQNSQGQPIPGYGAQWWLYNQRFADLPDDTIAARGNRGQFLFVIPSKQLIIVRRGYDLAAKPSFQEHQFAADVLEALSQ
ncbi:serine hydrolase domain-containing protein [Idiomarina xiamenensis]|uniref:Beta-lactamase class C family protein n=1 Tax=Idiomarina xiamenensis 10-D-4 TaxID=740709 RepID=K2K8N0_9GAMM|nr:serine hydrolase [Idiomarina xiamenensis]EKE82927.1 Beta-lactamase class C family protein [Idiomarina xiamenensis 10-D-4]